MSALAQLLAGALGAGGPPKIGPPPQSMHAPQGMGPSPMPQQAGHLAMPPAPPPPPMPGGGVLPGVAPKAPPNMAPPPPRAPGGAPISAKAPPAAAPKHADVESKAEDKKEKPGDEEKEDGGMMGAAKKALSKKAPPPKGKSDFKPKKESKDD